MQSESMLRRLFAGLRHRNYRYYWMGQLSLGAGPQHGAGGPGVAGVPADGFAPDAGGGRDRLRRAAGFPGARGRRHRGPGRQAAHHGADPVPAGPGLPGAGVAGSDRGASPSGTCSCLRSTRVCCAPSIGPAGTRCCPRWCRGRRSPTRLPWEARCGRRAVSWGPGLAGLLIHWFGVGYTFIACFVSSAVAVALWTFIRSRPIVGQAQGGMWRNILAGLDFVRRNQLFYSLLGLTCFNSIFGMSFVILMPGVRPGYPAGGLPRFRAAPVVLRRGRAAGHVDGGLSGPGRAQGLAGAGGGGDFRDAAHSVCVLFVVSLVPGTDLLSRAVQPDLPEPPSTRSCN